MSDRPEKQAPGKADQETISNDTHMDCIGVEIEWW